jgi:predicted transcriptional regulator
MELLHFIVAGLLFVIFILSGVIYFLAKANKELTDITETTFENEQRLANKLSNNYEALEETNRTLERINEGGSLSILIQQNKRILKNNKPESLEF